MGRIRKAIASISMAAIMSMLVVTTTASAFTDVPAGSWYEVNVQTGIQNGWIPDGTFFRPGDLTTRGETVNFVVRAVPFTLVTPATATYSDVPAVNPNYSYIETATAQGVVHGYGSGTAGKFGPNDPVTREQFAKIAVEAFDLAMVTPSAANLPFTDAGSISVWARGYVATAYAWGVLDGYPNGTFGPGLNINRAESAKISANAEAAFDGHPVRTPAAETPTPTPTGAGFRLGAGTEGSIDEVTLASADDSEALEGEVEVEVYAFDIALEDSGPLQLQRADVYFGESSGGVGVSTKPWDYFEEVSLTVEGAIVATIDTSTSGGWSAKTDGNLSDGDTVDNEYRLRFTGLESTLLADETTRVGMLVTVKSALDSDDEAAVWQTDVTELRVMDETGFVNAYDVSSEDSETALEETFDMDQATVASLDWSEADAQIDAMVVEVSDTADTNGVSIYSFEIEEEEGIDANITDMTLTFTAVTAADAALTESNVVKNAYLYQGSTLRGTESMTSTGLVVFDNVDIDVAGDATETFTVKVDLEDTLDQTRYADGAKLQVEATTINEVSDANGNDEDDITLPTPALTSEIHELRVDGVVFAFVSATQARSFSADAATENDEGEFKITFKATAFGTDARLDKSCEEGAADLAGQGVEYTITNAASNGTTCILSAATTDTEDNTLVFELDEDQARTFTLTVFATAEVTATAEVSIDSFNWGALLTDLNANYYTFDLGDYKTDALNLRSL